MPRILDNSHIIARPKDASPLSGLDKIWYRVQGTGLIHDLRQTSYCLMLEDRC